MQSGSIRGRLGPASLAVAVICLGLLASGCRDEGGIEVTDLTFTGVHVVETSKLRQIITTRQSGRLPWSARHDFDRADFEADLDRIHAFYADRGYPHERVANIDLEIDDTQTSVRIRIDIDEGAPLIIEHLRFDGFEALSDDARQTLDQTPLRVGQPRDREAVRAARDLGARLFREDGHPLVRVDTFETPGSGPDRVDVTIRADPGPPLRFGAVQIDGLPQEDEQIVRRLLAFEPGAPYRESHVVATQQRLRSLALFDLATIAPQLDDVEEGRVPMLVTVVEGKPRRLSVGVGYGTDDRGRGTITWRHLNFHGGARELAVNGKASFLTRSSDISLTQPYLGRPGLSLTVSGNAAKTEQLSYDVERYGGQIALGYQVDRPGPLPGPSPHYDARVSYTHEYLRYGIQPGAFLDPSRRDERIALGLDPDTGRGAGTLASVGFDLQRTRVDDPVEPRHGTVASLHLEHAAPWLLGSYRFDEIRVDGTHFFTIDPVTVTSRFVYSTVGASSPQDVPFSKRYFLGGATTLRGWGRFQVSPLDDAGLPVGGRSLLMASIEARFPIRGKLEGAVFVDAGNVWTSDWNVQGARLRLDAGPGLRYRSPVGVLRVDVGYQLTPIAGLIVNGQPQTRRWRIQFGIGHPF